MTAGNMRQGPWFPTVRGASMALAILFADCASFRPRPLSPAPNAADFESRSLADPGLRAFLELHLHRRISPWPPSSLDWPILLLTALYYQPELAVARARQEVAQAAIVTAGAIPNPTLSASFGVISNPADVSRWLYGLSLGLPIETAGKRGHRIARATRLAEAARADVATVAWGVRSRLLARLLDARAARETETLLDAQVKTEVELVSLLQDRLEAGEISRPDLTLATIALDRDRLALADAQRETAVSRVRLAEALGMPVGALAEVTFSAAVPERFPAIPPEALQRRALQSRADIIAGLAEYEAAQAALQLEVARQYPDICLGPAYDFDDGENKWTLGVSVTLPLFNRNQGPIEEAEARRRQAAAHFTAVQARVIAAIDSARAAYAGALEKLATAQRLLEAQQAQERSARARLEAGEEDRLALLSAKLEASAAALGRVQAFYQAQQALGLLEDAIQQDLRSETPPAATPHSGLQSAPEKSP
jgi:cobalt-zinc-cadmium efflux system outer membrane protein